MPEDKDLEKVMAEDEEHDLAISEIQSSTTSASRSVEEISVPQNSRSKFAAGEQSTGLSLTRTISALSRVPSTIPITPPPDGGTKAYLQIAGAFCINASAWVSICHFLVHVDLLLMHPAGRDQHLGRVSNLLRHRPVTGLLGVNTLLDRLIASHARLPSRHLQRQTRGCGLFLPRRLSRHRTAGRGPLHRERQHGILAAAALAGDMSWFGNGVVVHACCCAGQHVLRQEACVGFGDCRIGNWCAWDYLAGHHQGDAASHWIWMGIEDRR